MHSLGTCNLSNNSLVNRREGAYGDNIEDLVDPTNAEEALEATTTEVANIVALKLPLWPLRWFRILVDEPVHLFETCYAPLVIVRYRRHEFYEWGCDGYLLL
ncbi:unnamed protein product [Lupinus luteus]|uniref:Uncharacterized protein n=1 Tax=Lupinus luteus TaxID=3873 RepID=A0AAV1YFJ6_LUPLU